MLPFISLPSPSVPSFSIPSPLHFSLSFLTTSPPSILPNLPGPSLSYSIPSSSLSLLLLLSIPPFYPLPPPPHTTSISPSHTSSPLCISHSYPSHAFPSHLPHCPSLSFLSHPPPPSSPSQLKVMELSDALEASGSYSKAEISERVSKFRDKLMQVGLQQSICFIFAPAH